MPARVWFPDAREKEANLGFADRLRKLGGGWLCRRGQNGRDFEVDRVGGQSGRKGVRRFGETAVLLARETFAALGKAVRLAKLGLGDRSRHDLTGADAERDRSRRQAEDERKNREPDCES